MKTFVRYKCLIFYKDQANQMHIKDVNKTVSNVN